MQESKRKAPPWRTALREPEELAEQSTKFVEEKVVVQLVVDKETTEELVDVQEVNSLLVN